MMIDIFKSSSSRACLAVRAGTDINTLSPELIAPLGREVVRMRKNMPFDRFSYPEAQKAIEEVGGYRFDIDVKTSNGFVGSSGPTQY